MADISRATFSVVAIIQPAKGQVKHSRSEDKVGEMLRNVIWLVVILLVVGCATAVPAPTPTPETIVIAPTSTTTLAPPTSTPLIFTQATWVANVAKDFEIIEVETPIILAEEESENAAGTYRAMEACADGYCDIFIEEIISHSTYRLAAPSLSRNRFFIDLAWPSETILEFTLVTQPHHGVRFAVNIETATIIDALPMPLE